ncbi:MAG TPA: TolC family protein [Pirellulales bacterium]|jgi:cobalt-zinc-cadmium efflux system outer membrane protein|nr:TolC family protein [Pirellulales bacterium]
MMRSVAIALLAAIAVLHARPVCAQLTSLADDIILLSEGVEAQEAARSGSHLGGTIGGQQSMLGPTAGGREPLIAERTLGSSSTGSAFASADVLAAISRQGQQSLRSERLPMIARRQTSEPSEPLYGQLDLPEAEEDGPPGGMTLDTAIQRLLVASIDLQTKALELPQARADVLSASLLANPLVFATASSIPYGSYSPTRPGENGYSATVIYPLDVSKKRLARTDVASQAQHVLEAQYQDAVRMEVDRLYTAYVDVVAARDTVRYSQASQAGLRSMSDRIRTQFESSLASRPDLERVLIQADLAEIGVEQAEVALRHAKQSLAVVLNLPWDEVDRLDLKATLLDRAPLPDREQLRTIALRVRPDIVAYMLGVQRAQADVRLAQSEKYSDLFMLWSPYEFRNNVPTGGQNATSWSIAAFTSLPLFNRNQGNIRRAEVNVSQTQSELVAIQRQVVAEVERVYAEYISSRTAAEKLERFILPRSKRIRDASAHLLQVGEISPVDYLNAQKDYNEVVRQYRDVLIRHRRSMLKLNTVVGQRVLP